MRDRIHIPGQAFFWGFVDCTPFILIVVLYSMLFGVVVVPFALIDEVISAIRDISIVENALDAKVREGFCEVPAVSQMIADGRAKIID